MNIWDCIGWRIVPTNCQINKAGEAIMGAGLAKQAAMRYPNLPKLLGINLKSFVLCRQSCHFFKEYKIVAFPTKYNWKDDSDLDLIDDAACSLADFIKNFPSVHLNEQFYIPQVGTGLGRLKWEDVKPVLDKHLKEYEDSGSVVYV